MADNSKECRGKIDYYFIFFAVLMALEVHYCAHKIGDGISAHLKEKREANQIRQP
jgi:uncharacterized metal-binding protein